MFFHQIVKSTWHDLSDYGMDFEKVVSGLKLLGMNLFDFALYDESGIHSHQFQPCNRCNNSYSVAKVFVMTAVGLLWDDGMLNVSDPLYKLFQTDFPKDADPGWKLTTVEHALTHRLGFDKGFLDIDAEDSAEYPTEDYLQIVLSHPLHYLPGTYRQYSDAAFYLLSRVVSRVAGVNMDSLLFRRLFRPMHFSEVAWSRCPHEYPIGATGLYVSARDMVKLGALYLNNGVWQGKRLISSEWISKAISSEYEFQTMTPSGLIGKGGMYGQGLAFSREKRFAVAWHAFEKGGNGKKLIEYLDRIE